MNHTVGRKTTARNSATRSTQNQMRGTTPVVESISITQFLKPSLRDWHDPPEPIKVIAQPVANLDANMALGSALKDEILLNESLKARLKAWETKSTISHVHDPKLGRVEALLAENRKLRKWGEDAHNDLKTMTQSVHTLQRDSAEWQIKCDALSQELSDERKLKHNLEVRLIENETKLGQLQAELEIKKKSSDWLVHEQERTEDQGSRSLDVQSSSGLMKNLGYIYQILQSCITKLGGPNPVGLNFKPINLQVLLVEIRSLSISLNSEIDLNESKRAALEKKYISACSKLHESEDIVHRLNKVIEESNSDLRAELERAELLEAKLVQLEEENAKIMSQRGPTGGLTQSGALAVPDHMSRSGMNSSIQPYIDHLEGSLALQEHLNGLHKQVLSRLLTSLQPRISEVVENFIQTNTDLIVLGDGHPFNIDINTASVGMIAESLEDWKSKFETEKSKRIHQSMQKGNLHVELELAEHEFDKALEKLRSLQNLDAMEMMDVQTGLDQDPQAELNPYLSESLKYVRPSSAKQNKPNRNKSEEGLKNSSGSANSRGGYKGFGDTGTDFSDIKTKLRIIKAHNLGSED